MNVFPFCGRMFSEGGIEMKKGLILEGGAMRGLFSAGVIDILMENNTEFDGMVGVSAGAAFGSNYKSKQIGRVLRYNKRFCKDKRYCSMHSLITTGNLYGVDFCYNVLPEKIDIFDKEAFDKNPMEFYIVCTDVETGKPFYKECNKFDKDTYEWIRASASLPLVSTVVEIDGGKYLDGGISDAVPLKFFESIGYEKNVVILTQPKGYVKKKTGMMGLMKRVLKKYPKVVEALERRHIMYNETTEYIFSQQKKGNVFVICPKEPLPIKRVEKNPEVLQQVYELGREAALENIEKLKEFLN